MAHGYEVQQINGWWYVVCTLPWSEGERFAGPYATEERAAAQVPQARA